MFRSVRQNSPIRKRFTVAALAFLLSLLLLPVHDAHLSFLPCAPIARHNWLIAQKHNDWVAVNRPDGTPDACRWQMDSSYCYWAWHYLDDACVFSGEQRYAALRKLRLWIGPIAYYRGELPPPIPLWLYRDRDR